jgi:hypothetical protein
MATAKTDCMAGTPANEPDTPYYEITRDILPYSNYSRLSEAELRQRGIEFDNHYERFDLDEPENHQQSDRKTA